MKDFRTVYDKYKSLWYVVDYGTKIFKSHSLKDVDFFIAEKYENSFCREDI